MKHKNPKTPKHSLKALEVFGPGNPRSDAGCLGPGLANSWLQIEEFWAERVSRASRVSRV